jgi:hypothetical protein
MITILCKFTPIFLHHIYQTLSQIDIFLTYFNCLTKRSFKAIFLLEIFDEQVAFTILAVRERLLSVIPVGDRQEQINNADCVVFLFDGRTH